MTSARIVCLVATILITGWSWAQEQTQIQPPVRPQTQAADKKNLSPDDVIKEFSAKETDFYEAWKEYAYKQTAEVRVLSVNGMARNERMTLISQIVFRDDGTREVSIVRRAGTLQSVEWTLDDEKVINDIQPFALTTKELPLYNLSYEGKERVDELNCYVFSVKPKSLKGGKMYFDGKIWVDDQDLQIVRTVGKPVPQSKKSQFPDFETIRQMIDNKYWFPVWTHADSQLHFAQETVHIEETITYEDYKRFGSKTKIEFGAPTKPPDKP